MKNLFLIQAGFIDSVNFLNYLSEVSGIPYSLLNKEYFNDNQVILNEHYFKNVWRNIYKKEYPIYEEFILKLDDDEFADKISNDKFSIFKYKIIEE